MDGYELKSTKLRPAKGENWLLLFFNYREGVNNVYRSPTLLKFDTSEKISKLDNHLRNSVFSGYKLKYFKIDGASKAYSIDYQLENQMAVELKAQDQIPSNIYVLLEAAKPFIRTNM